MDPILLKDAARRMVEARAELLNQHPFFGRLIMRLKFQFADCGTAYTDMNSIVFDPGFAGRLTDEGLRFVLLHELMHCVLKHCLRGRGKLHILYNIACDIVVNSLLLEALGLKDITVDGENAMHLTPSGEEGRNYSADEVYRMLLEEGLDGEGFPGGFDSHEIWETIGASPLLSDLWDQFTLDAAKGAGSGSGIPEGLQRHIEHLQHRQKICWQQVLQDFIRYSRSDYLYAPPDKRFQDDLILPSFCENVSGSKAENLWYAVDTSGSVSSVAIWEAFEEIKDAIEQLDSLEGFVSFFDTHITEPIPFSGVTDIEEMIPVGGGGTSFREIFRKMPRMFPEELPTAVIIITDGYDTFPKEEEALGVPVIWIIVDSEVNPPWGEVVHVYTR